ncbi:MAG: chemotaxis protein CheD [Magnetospirillum sp.]|nr:chemotaxis protein CheD [Magnetospirillum sp.]
MNHFALPSATRGQKGPRHGCDGIDLLVQGMADLGRRRPNLRAKLSGGSAVLPMAGSGGICASNIAVAIDHLAIHGIPIIGRRTGGNQGMLVHFFTGSGDALFRPIIRQLFEEGSQP